MELQSACAFLQNCPRRTHFSLARLHIVKKHYGKHSLLERQTLRFQVERKSHLPSSRSGVVVSAAYNNSSRKLGFRVVARTGSEPFCGKSGSVSFTGSTHQSVEESKLVSAPFNENTGSLIWVLGPVALISALIVPQFFIIGAIEDSLKNEVFAGITELLSESSWFEIGNWWLLSMSNLFVCLFLAMLAISEL